MTDDGVCGGGSVSAASPVRTRADEEVPPPLLETLDV